MAQSMSIVIPSFQREAQLETLLDSLSSALTAPAGSVTTGDGDVLIGEVVVVLDGSTDGSRALIDRLRAEFPVPLRYEWQPNRGLAAARNAGVAASTGDLVWFLDDDMTVDRSAVGQHLRHRRAPAPILMGPCEVASVDPEVVRSSWWYAERHHRLAGDGVVSAAKDCSFANTSAPVDLLRSHPFDESFRGYGLEDFELAIRLLHHDVRIAFDIDAAVTHDYSPTRSETMRKLREEGANRLRFRELHPTHADVVFPPNPGRAERVCRAVTPLPGADRIMWTLARLVDRVATSIRPRSMQYRLRYVAEQLAIYSGIAGDESTPV